MYVDRNTMPWNQSTVITNNRPAVWSSMTTHNTRNDNMSPHAKCGCITYVCLHKFKPPCNNFLSSDISIGVDMVLLKNSQEVLYISHAKFVWGCRLIKIDIVGNWAKSRWALLKKDLQLGIFCLCEHLFLCVSRYWHSSMNNFAWKLSSAILLVKFDFQ